MLPIGLFLFLFTLNMAKNGLPTSETIRYRNYWPLHKISVDGICILPFMPLNHVKLKKNKKNTGSGLVDDSGGVRGYYWIAAKARMTRGGETTGFSRTAPLASLNGKARDWFMIFIITILRNNEGYFSGLSYISCAISVEGKNKK